VTSSFKRYYPAFLDLERRPVVVVGEGEAAEKRVRQLLRYDADVIVITPEPSAALLEAQSDGLLTIEPRSYVRGDLGGTFLALCITEDEEVRRAVADEAESIGCLVNVAGAPKLCNFVMPGVVHREPLQIAISTGGVAPEVAKDVRKQLGAQFGPEYGVWVGLTAEVRALAFESIEDAEEQQWIMAGALEPSVLERITSGEELTAAGLIEELREGWPPGAETDVVADAAPAATAEEPAE
jgi:precorrin-2 dehydrogenase/sirohydrochlorin ferrochelatase